MDKDDKRILAKYHGIRITSGFVITAATILIFVLLMLVLMKLDVIAVPSFLQVFIGGGETTDNKVESTENTIPDFGSDAISVENIYHQFEDDPKKFLESVRESEAYVREFRVINSYADKIDIRRYTLTVSGDQYRLESDNKTVICDGKNACTITETYRTDIIDTAFTKESEAGITPLEEVKAAAEEGNVSINSSNEKNLLILSDDEESGITSEYIVSIETGIVVSERSYINGVSYRIVITDSVSLLTKDTLPEDYFQIP